MTSAGDHIVWPAYGAVSAAKSALESYVRQIAVELAPHGVAVERAAGRSHRHARAAEDPRQRGDDRARARPCIPAGRLTTPRGRGGRARRALRRGRRVGLAATSSASTAPKTSRAEGSRRLGPVSVFFELARRRETHGVAASSGIRLVRRRPGSASSDAANGLRCSCSRTASRRSRRSRRLPRRQPQRGRRLHGRDAPARAPDVQGHAGVPPRPRGPRSPRCSRRSARASTRRPGSTGRTTTRRFRRTRSTSRCGSSPRACARRCCATTTASPR